jgi:hypothetical protein
VDGLLSVESDCEEEVRLLCRYLTVGGIFGDMIDRRVDTDPCWCVRPLNSTWYSPVCNFDCAEDCNMYEMYGTG